MFNPLISVTLFSVSLFVAAIYKLKQKILVFKRRLVLFADVLEKEKLRYSLSIYPPVC